MTSSFSVVPEMIFTATEAIGFAYGVTWSTMRRNIFNSKHDEVGNLEANVKSFCDVPHLLRFLKDFIIFRGKEEELQKVILRQHRTTAVDKVVARALDPKRSRGLVWHTQGSGRTYTMIKSQSIPSVARKSRRLDDICTNPAFCVYDQRIVSTVAPADMRRAKADVGYAECAIGLEGYCRGPVAISSGPLSERNPRREYRGGSGSTVEFSARLTLCFWRQRRGPVHVDRAPQWMLLSFDSR